MSPSKTSVRAILAAEAAGIGGVTTDVACRGTVLESKTYKAGKSAFLFLGAKDARLKLAASLDEARRVAEEHPDALRVGSGGWTSLRLEGQAALGAPRLRRWVRESHALFAPTRVEAPTRRKA